MELKGWLAAGKTVRKSDVPVKGGMVWSVGGE